jgi:sterol desaturase/sphingolipid hydroxylase (fatty acid hydroxylase superfamily)
MGSRGFLLYSLPPASKMDKNIYATPPRISQYHHCKYTDRCFGVTVTWWDHLFFTAPPKAISLSDRIVDFYYQSSTIKP